MPELLSRGPSLVKAVSILLAIFSFSGCAAAPFTIDTYKPWATFLYDEGRTNYSQEEVVVPMDVAWTEGVDGLSILRPTPLLRRAQSSSPIIHSGAVYTGSSSGDIFALSLENGKTLWSFSTDSTIEAAPTVNDEMICFGSTAGTLHCLEKTSGRELWRHQARSEIHSSPIIGKNAVYFLSSDNKLYSLNKATGEKVWAYTRKTSSVVKTTFFSSLAASGDRLYALFSDGFLVCLDKDTGKEFWTKKIIQNPSEALRARRTPLIRDGLVYMIDDKGIILALDVLTGETKIAYDVAKTIDLIVADDEIFIAGQDYLMAIKRDSGNILWDKPLKKGQAVSMAGAGRFVFVLSNQQL
ncbi:MAG: PQQ-like beta-propeller repeat protein, partial [Deltaproteobacteria bacterium]|nr:PQQ-like beta-propeller repeat protein [Deltaproteobacteria bacterium]